MCEFPAAKLLQMRRQITTEADASQDDAFVTRAARFVKEVDELRLTHQDLTGCACWEEAVKAERAA